MESKRQRLTEDELVNWADESGHSYETVKAASERGWDPDEFSASVVSRADETDDVVNQLVKLYDQELKFHVLTEEHQSRFFHAFDNDQEDEICIPRESKDLIFKVLYGYHHAIEEFKNSYVQGSTTKRLCVFTVRAMKTTRHDVLAELVTSIPTEEELERQTGFIEKFGEILAPRKRNGFEGIDFDDETVDELQL